MWPRSKAPPIEQKPTLPLPYTGFSRERIQGLLDLAATGDQASLRGEHGLPAVIDPDTGDSVVHRAAAVGNVSFMRGIMDTFGKQISQNPRAGATLLGPDRAPKPGGRHGPTRGGTHG